MSIEVIKSTIAAFLQVDASEISQSTPIDRTAVKSSIQLHRMYAKLAEQGIIVENYQSIKNFGQLLTSLSGKGNTRFENFSDNDFAVARYLQANLTDDPGIGIDIEEISQLPKVIDFREDEFYKMNFAPSEIAYCILRPDPYASFAALFAAKEALVKADNQLSKIPFNAIVIHHNADGKPVFGAHSISMAHIDSIAVAVAMRLPVQKEVPIVTATPTVKNGDKNTVLVVISLLLSLLAIGLILYKW